MAEPTPKTEARFVARARLAGQVIQGFAVGFLVVMAVAELYAGFGAKAFLYQGY